MAVQRGTMNWTTKVPVERTAGEVQAMLGAAGAGEVMLVWADRRPIGVRFTMSPESQRHKVAFSLPINADGVMELLAKQLRARKIKSAGGLTIAALGSREHAERVAWRVARDWLEAQLAMVDARMVTLDQVMLPYLVVEPIRDGEPPVTLFDRYSLSGMKALEAARDQQ